jgi:NAD(P)H dehydrogenase (quinone)
MIGITGASGHLGGQILRVVAGQLPVGRRLIAMTRNLLKAPELERFASEVRHADFAEPEKLPHAFRGIDTLLIVSVEGEDDERIRLHRNAVKSAVAAGVRRVVYTSFFDVDSNSPSSVARVHRLTEAELMSTGLDWVMLRDGPYADNFARRVAAAARQDGIFRMAAGNARLPFIGRNDLAQAAARAVLSDQSRVAWRLSGAELLCCEDLCALVSDRLRVPVRYQAITDQEQAVDLQRQGLSQDMIARRVAYGQAIRQGFMTALTDDFRRLVGHDPIRMSDLLLTLDLTPSSH